MNLARNRLLGASRSPVVMNVFTALLRYAGIDRAVHSTLNREELPVT